VLLEPDLAGYKLINHLVASGKLACHGADTYSVRLDGYNIVLDGAIPIACESDEYFSLLSHDEFFYAVFSALWQELGGTLHGKLREGMVGVTQAPFATHVSPQLAELIRDINKFSNNTMARQLFLTLGSLDGQAADIAQSSAVVRQWLLKQGLTFPELVLENGAGLSRKERISPQHLADVLQRGSRSLYSAELQASLPILGVDGTVKKRFKGHEIAGHAHLKTGTLDGVKSIAGYVHGQSGRKLVVVFIINHANAAQGQVAQDALIEWLQANN
jgi:D-alanyl-D-alanine carboxypeptidase/D-alanyl-D-alanine-endopeptidase (penicillin-binding protein 4)